MDRNKNLTDDYSNYVSNNNIAWIIPARYPAFVLEQINGGDVVLEELQLYREAQAALINPDDPTASVNLRVQATDGDRSGRLHIGFNQSLYVGSGKLPLDLSVYHGGETTLQGELRVAGVTVTVEGVLKNVENMTVVDGGNYVKLYRILNK
jgi:hypothetical protein